MSDPLEGKRAAINAGELQQLTWPDTGQGWPVDVGDIFSLRSCSIEITGRKRVQRGRGELAQWIYVATFKTYHPEKLHLLAADGYTTSASKAIKAQDDEHRFDSQEIDHQAPEPEAVSPQEVAKLPSTVAAKHRFASLRRHVDQERHAAQLSAKIRNLQKQAQRSGVDLGEQLDEVENLLQRVERGLSQVA